MHAPQGVQSTGTNRPRTCPTPSQPSSTTSHLKHDVVLLASTVHIPATTLCCSHCGVDRSKAGSWGWCGVPVVTAERETPGPIPNPEAKPSSADGTATEGSWESRTPPELHTTPTHTLSSARPAHPHPRGRTPVLSRFSRVRGAVTAPGDAEHRRDPSTARGSIHSSGSGRPVDPPARPRWSSPRPERPGRADRATGESG